jgi:hypothetical protein
MITQNHNNDLIKAGLGSSERNQLLAEVFIDLKKELSAPSVCLSILDEDESIIATRGNFSLVIGKPKSRKTFFTTTLMAAAVSSDCILGKIVGNLPSHKSRVVYFDTEQGSYHVQKVVKRVEKLTQSSLKNFEAFALRKFSYDIRLALIEEKIYATEDLGIVFIDGVRDLVSSINDEEQATKTITLLLKWTEERDIHIVCVLHQNKNDNNARGHLGTELVNKAETVISVKKPSDNKQISIVEAEYCREKEFGEFRFEIDENELPILSNSNYEKKKKIVLPENFEHEFHQSVLQMVFSEESKLNHSDLVHAIKGVMAIKGYKIGDNKSKDFVKYFVNEGTVIHGGTPNSRNSHYSLKPV